MKKKKKDKDTIKKKRFIEQTLITTPIKKAPKIEEQLLKNKYTIKDKSLVKQGRFKVNPERVKIVAEKEITKYDLISNER
jgi:hypothetical protein